MKIIYLGGIVALIMLPACWDYFNKKDVPAGLSLKDGSLYKIVPVKDYNPEMLEDCVILSLLDVKSGFIHMSYGSQVENILKKFFKGAEDTILLELDAEVLKSHGLGVRMEQNKPDGEFFPHVYGVQKIPSAAVRSVIKVYETPDGGWAVR